MRQLYDDLSAEFDDYHVFTGYATVDMLDFPCLSVFSVEKTHLSHHAYQISAIIEVFFEDSGKADDESIEWEEQLEKIEWHALESLSKITNIVDYKLDRKEDMLAEVHKPVSFYRLTFVSERIVGRHPNYLKKP